MKDIQLRPFKADWEKTNAMFKLPDGLIERIHNLMLPNNSLKSHEIISGGCSNVNIKLNLNDGSIKLVRIYLRDHEAVYREQGIAMLIGKAIPVPLISSIYEIDGFFCALCDFKSGITLRELLLSKHNYNLSTVMFQVGEALAKLQKFIFRTPGFFNDKLKVNNLFSIDDPISFSKTSLQHKVVKTVLTKSQVTLLGQMLDKHGILLEKMNAMHLVHGDFGPENILVDQVNNRWEISTILDWEFAFSGSVLWDVANMLRYAHCMPKRFELSFVSGLQSIGTKLPEEWEATTWYLNTVSLLDCLQRSNPENMPKRCADIKKLIEYFIAQLSSRTR